MKVLFVSSGNRFNGVSEIIKNQGDSLIAHGTDIDHYLISGFGFIGYLRNIRPLRKVIRKNNYDLIHAHYLFSAIIASLAFKKPIIVSLMGSEVYRNNLYLFLIRLFNKFLWSRLIVKTERMKKVMMIPEAIVLANGVNMSSFRPLDRDSCRYKIGWASDKKHILFPSWPERIEKNFSLAKETINLLPDIDLELHYIKDISHNDLIYYYNAADVILMTSTREGSPNVIKEALACNRPVVSTDVGDVSTLIDNLENCYITTFNPEDIAEQIRRVINSNTQPDGRKRLIELNLDSDLVAKKLIRIYNDSLNTKKKH